MIPGARIERFWHDESPLDRPISRHRKRSTDYRTDYLSFRGRKRCTAVSNKAPLLSIDLQGAGCRLFAAYHQSPLTNGPYSTDNLPLSPVGHSASVIHYRNRTFLGFRASTGQHEQYSSRLGGPPSPLVALT